MKIEILKGLLTDLMVVNRYVKQPNSDLARSAVYKVKEDTIRYLLSHKLAEAELLEVNFKDDTHSNTQFLYLVKIRLEDVECVVHQVATSYLTKFFEKQGIDFSNFSATEFKAEEKDPISNKDGNAAWDRIVSSIEDSEWCIADHLDLKRWNNKMECIYNVRIKEPSSGKWKDPSTMFTVIYTRKDGKTTFELCPAKTFRKHFIKLIPKFLSPRYGYKNSNI